MRVWVLMGCVGCAADFEPFDPPDPASDYAVRFPTTRPELPACDERGGQPWIEELDDVARSYWPVVDVILCPGDQHAIDLTYPGWAEGSEIIVDGPIGGLEVELVWSSGSQPIEPTGDRFVLPDDDNGDPCEWGGHDILIRSTATASPVTYDLWFLWGGEMCCCAE